MPSYISCRMKKSLNKTVIHTIHYIIYYCDYVRTREQLRRKKIIIAYWFGSNSKPLILLSKLSAQWYYVNYVTLWGYFTAWDINFSTVYIFLNWLQNYLTHCMCTNLTFWYTTHKISFLFWYFFLIVLYSLKVFFLFSFFFSYTIARYLFFNEFIWC